ncbi:polyprenyl synthetase family protein [Natronobacterium gregoryi]|uniref:Geranylgeranyl pyrophosphate synthase n=2 Tax=Natronobacterium gregoryi TaxID=44930 RepID=L0AE52_NATGS|nr:polyprenyl synthetase family protein [Natronobacterium gregoryi]AFZ71704.1 geranylgeranyl pyrophosphate synthase [Natronobacterium gregoryi SP2]ELY72724.1 polyprenyl synthetase [Natronobacterium gregoryi SP2]PLK20248.1 polyprenyl synthetase family protein [Natronobacterium gregoryi SP2]SFJ26137.1 geranylgeranyl diphosphate synthase, type I [Natronobacterium gregoryi]
MRETLAEWRPAIDEAIEDLVPREIDDEYLESFFGEATYKYDTAGLQRALADPFWELLDRGGKRWRAVLFLVFVEEFGEDPEEYLPYACIPEILHNGTIIVDDVEDGATKRRGQPALHHIYGQDIALNAGNALYFLPLKVLTENPAGLPADRRLAAHEMLTCELNRTHLGQGMDIRWHNEGDAEISTDEYLEMCACKTGCLARIVARLAAIITDQSAAVEDALANYAELTAVAFQIGDDILDVENSLGRAGEFGKEFGNDVREGKKTLLVIHALEESPSADAARLTEILEADENTDEEVLEALSILEDAGSIEYARERALDLAARARTELDAVDLGDETTRKLEEFTTFVIERDE